MNQTETDEVVGQVFSCFDKLPKNGKPTAQNEWTTLAAFVLKTDSHCDVVSLATGTSCISANKLDTKGHRVSDSHAEVLARRAFQRYLTDQISKACKSDTSVLISDEGGKLRMKDEVNVIFVTTQTPCGDCSIFPREDGDIHPHKRRKLNDMTTPKSTYGTVPKGPPQAKTTSEMVSNVADIHRTGAKCVAGPLQDPLQAGADYHVTGALRLKPGRGERTQSLSCSDKLSRWILLGCQGCLPMLILSKPIYVDHIIVAGCPYNKAAMKRGIFDRFSCQVDSPAGTYSRHMPTLSYVETVFKRSKQSVEGRNAEGKIVACFSNIIYFSDGVRPGAGLCEAAVDGYKLGVTKKSLGLPASRLMVCRSEVVRQFISTLSSLPDSAVSGLRERLDRPTYGQLKSKSSYWKFWDTLKKSDELYKLWPVKDKRYSEFNVI